MATAKPKLSDKDKEDYVKLTDYIQLLHIQNGIDKNSIKWNIMTAQIKNYMADNKSLTYAQIKYVLWYMVEILELNLFDESFNGTILNLVPYYINEAKEFCIKCKDIKKLANEFDFTENVKIVKVRNRSNKVEEMEFWLIPL